MSPGAFVFKTFNQTGENIMAAPDRFEHKPVMFICGDDPDRKKNVLHPVKQVGLEAVDAGDLRSARLLESMALLWIQLAHRQGLGRDFVFALEHAAAPTGE